MSNDDSTVVPNDDYCKLSYYLFSTLKECGIDVLQDAVLDYQNFGSQSQDKKDALLKLASGKTCCLETLSHKTIFLDSKSATKLLSSTSSSDSNNNISPQKTYLPLDQATKLLDMDTLLFGGMMEVMPTRVMVCNEQWAREYYVEPLRRLQQHNQGDSAIASVSDQEIADMFVRSNTDDERASGMLGMMEKMQQLMTEKKAAKEDEDTFQSFSGQGNSLGAATISNSDNSALLLGRFDPATLPDTPAAVDTSQPTTSIAVRLLNGKRQVVKLNPNQTVADLASHLKASVDGPFRIAGGFPPKPLEDPNASVEDAGLKGAQVSLLKAE